MNEGRVHQIFEISVLLKGAHALIECIGGLALTFVAHWIVQVGKLESYIGPAPLIYSSLMIIFTFATWILFYQN